MPTLASVATFFGMSSTSSAIRNRESKCLYAPYLSDNIPYCERGLVKGGASIAWKILYFAAWFVTSNGSIITIRRMYWVVAYFDNV